MAKKQRDRLNFSNMDELKHNPFANLGAALGVEPPADDTSPAPQPAAAKPPQPMLTLQLEKRKSGKVVTCIHHIQNGHKDELSLLKKKLAVGGTVQEGVIELQGDVRDRAAKHLSNRGFKVRTSAK